jgi:hypothetical protein
MVNVYSKEIAKLEVEEKAVMAEDEEELVKTRRVRLPDAFLHLFAVSPAECRSKTTLMLDPTSQYCRSSSGIVRD